MCKITPALKVIQDIYRHQERIRLLDYYFYKD